MRHLHRIYCHRCQWILSLIRTSILTFNWITKWCSLSTCVFLFQQWKMSCFADLTFMNHIMWQERKETREKKDYWEKEREVRPNFKRNGVIGSRNMDLLLEEKGKGRRHDCIQILERNRLVAFERMILHER